MLLAGFRFVALWFIFDCEVIVEWFVDSVLTGFCVWIALLFVLVYFRAYFVFCLWTFRGVFRYWNLWNCYDDVVVLGEEGWFTLYFVWFVFKGFTVGFCF